MWGRVKVVGPPVGVTVCVPLLVQTMSIVPVTVTGSLKVTLTGASTGTLLAPVVGVVLEHGGRNIDTAVIGGERRVARGRRARR